MSALHGRADTTQLHALAARSARLGPALQAAQRRRLPAVAKLSVQDIQAEVRKPPLRPSSVPKHRGLRQGIAAGVKVQVLSGQKSGAAIVVAADALPADQKHLLGPYDKPSGWKHPVFDTGVWTSQTGRPYFASIVPRRRAEQIAAGRAILADGAASLK